MLGLGMWRRLVAGVQVSAPAHTSCAVGPRGGLGGWRDVSLQVMGIRNTLDAEFGTEQLSAGASMAYVAVPPPPSFSVLAASCPHPMRAVP